MSAANDNKLAYSIPEAAKALGISKTTIWRLIAAGDLSTFKIGCRTLIRSDALRGLVDRHSKAA